MMKKQIFSVGFILAFITPSMGQKQRTLMDKFKFIPLENQHYSPVIFYNENDTTLLSSSSRVVQNESPLDHYFLGKQEVSNAEYLLFERWVNLGATTREFILYFSNKFSASGCVSR